MPGLYDADRVGKIGEIMPRFSAHVREGDEIALGLEGDPLFPEQFRSHRPTGTVVKVKAIDDTREMTTIRVRMNDDGSVIDLHPGSVDPQRVWEFTDRSYNEVLERATRSARLDDDGPEYRGGGGGDDVGELRREMEQMRESFEKEVQEARVFNNTLLATLNEMAADVCKNNSDAKFCSVFVSEYKNMTHPPDSNPEPYFDSDMSSDASGSEDESIF